MPSELLKTLMTQATAGRLVLPDFQRDFVWKPSDVSKLLASLLNGYPIGGLLFMENPGIYGHRALDGATMATKSPGDTRLILDGQQRLTSCFRAFVNGPGIDRYPGRYYIDYAKFLQNPKLANSEVEELIEFVREKDVLRNLVNTTMEQGKSLFPLDITLEAPRGTDYSKWLSDFTFAQARGDEDRFHELSQLQSDFIRRFIEKITSYQVHYEEIKKDTSSDVICTVFDLQSFDHHHIAGNLLVHEGGPADDAPRPVILFGDVALVEHIACILNTSTNHIRYNVITPDAALRNMLLQCGTSWLDDSLAFEEGSRPFAEWTRRLTVFGVTTVTPLEMRAFNRISLRFNIPWIHAVMDGPFLFIGPTFIPFRSPCYECLETRILMNIRDGASYQRYKLALAEGRITGSGAPLDTVLGAILASLTAFEAVNFLLTGAAFTVGKMLSIYLPTMEFTFNEVLRLPDCSACSPAAGRDDKELYFDVRALLDEAFSLK